MSDTKIKIAIFASGKGSNTLNLIHYFKQHPKIEIALVLSNKIDAAVLEIAKSNDIASHHVENQLIEKPFYLRDFCKQQEIDYIVLAGFLRKIPLDLISSYSERIINIHPALLPKFGGQGMYGLKVHEAVKLAKETKTGITVHFVDEVYDHGKIIKQYSCEVNPDDSIETIQQKVQTLEATYFPKIVEDVVLNEVKF